MYFILNSQSKAIFVLNYHWEMKVCILQILMKQVQRGFTTQWSKRKTEIRKLSATKTLWQKFKLNNFWKSFSLPKIIPIMGTITWFLALFYEYSKNKTRKLYKKYFLSLLHFEKSKSLHSSISESVCLSVHTYVCLSSQKKFC